MDMHLKINLQIWHRYPLSEAKNRMSPSLIKPILELFKVGKDALSKKVISL
jgi:hypothetical protein